MLFNSFPFLFVFLPVALAGFYASAMLGKSVARLWLVLVSFAFYMWWHPAFVVILATSIAFNYLCGIGIQRLRDKPGQTALVIFAITANLAALFYYKYAFALTAWLVENGVGHQVWADQVLLPLGISFFTFTQIGFLLDSREGAVRDGNLLNYVLFVTFFPHLIAGPILHHKEIMPQYQRDETYKLDGDGFARGYSLFIIGLFKKTAVADTFSVYANDGFANAGSSSLFGAWGALLFYSLQLYFDFSGYSDMAIGIARMFGVKFPINFNSPYRATSIIEFWSRWHMTLTRYLNLYLYNPLAIWATRRIAARGKPINRKALAKPIPFAQVVVGPIVFTMFLAGIWHGAGLQFIIFGLLHAFYLVCNHAWRTFGPSKPKNAPAVPVWREWAATIGCVALTYFAVLIGQVFFRAPSTGVAFQLLAGMSGLHGISFALPVPHSLPQQLGSLGAWLQGHGLIAPVDLLQDGTTPALSIVEMALAYLAVWLLPNSQTIVGISGPNIQDKRSAHTSETGRAMAFRPSTRWGLAMGLATAVALLEVGAQSEFLYFQF